MKKSLLSLCVASLAFSTTAFALEEKKDAATPESKPDPALELFKNADKSVDLGGFGSDQPVEREDMPTRGIVKLGPEAFTRTSQQHWEQFDWKAFKMSRWGRYHVRLTYSLKFAFLPSQFRIGTQAVKHPLTATPVPTRLYLGEVYLDKAGEYGCSFYVPSTAAESKLEIYELALIPAPEGPTAKQTADGHITLEAKSATTWSETMRYEPKPEKNCLGFWTSIDDFAEWEFEVMKPGRFAVSVFHGCGSGNQGSDVAVKVGTTKLKFKTADTGGFQKWKEVKLGEVEIAAAGKTRLSMDPVNKVKSAVLDVQKVVLTPVK